MKKHNRYIRQTPWYDKRGNQMMALYTLIAIALLTGGLPW